MKVFFSILTKSSSKYIKKVLLLPELSFLRQTSLKKQKYILFNFALSKIKLLLRHYILLNYFGNSSQLIFSGPYIIRFLTKRKVQFHLVPTDTALLSISTEYMHHLIRSWYDLLIDTDDCCALGIMLSNGVLLDHIVYLSGRITFT